MQLLSLPTTKNDMKQLSLPTHLPEQPIFRAFDIDEPYLIPTYQRNLPHLRELMKDTFVDSSARGAFMVKLADVY